MRRGILSAAAMGLLAIPFLGTRLVSTAQGDLLAARWQGPLWVAGIVLLFSLLSGTVPRQPLKNLGKAGKGALSLLGSPGATLVWLSAAVVIPLLPREWMQHRVAGWEMGGVHPLGWLTVENLTNLWLYIVLALGLNLIVGQTGVLVLGYGGFYAVGAYTMALLATGLPCCQMARGFLPYWWAVGLGILGGAMLAASAGVLVGFPALRLKGDYLAIVTLAFGEVLVLVLKNWAPVTGGTNGLNITPSMVRPLKETWAYPTGTWHYYLALAAAALSIPFHARLNRSRIGRALLAIREDETAARAMGIDAARLKLLAFALAAAWAGVAGALFAARQRFITPESFTFLESVVILAMVVLGGMGSLRGVAFGAVLVTLLLEALRELNALLGHVEALRELGDCRMLVFGALLVTVMIFRPQGLVPERREVPR